MKPQNDIKRIVIELGKRIEDTNNIIIELVEGTGKNPLKAELLTE